MKSNSVSAVAHCKLCLKNEPLRHSHIIPEFSYKPMYDDKHRFMIVSADASEPVRHKFKGLREYLLCDACEQRLGIHESYVSRVLFGGVGFTGTTKGSNHHISGQEYSNIRLFHLSLLWRMGISTLPLFKNVVLGSHEEKLRQMLLTDDPSEPNQYGFICAVARIDGKLSSDWIVEPTRGRIGPHHIYQIIVSGLLYVFFVDARPIPAPFNEGFIQKSGDWMILDGEISQIPFWRDYLLKQAAAMKQRTG